MAFDKLSKSQFLCFRSIIGSKIIHEGEILRFMTLTTVKDMSRSIMKCFNVLVKRIKREYGYFEYLFVLTSEGVNGVLHILFYGSYIDQGWLSDNWKDITNGAFIVGLNVVKEDNSKRLFRYVVSQINLFGYVAGQSKYIRCGYSKDFIYKGWKKDYLDMHRFYFFKYWQYQYGSFHYSLDYFKGFPLTYWDFYNDWLMFLSIKRVFKNCKWFDLKELYLDSYLMNFQCKLDYYLK